MKDISFSIASYIQDRNMLYFSAQDNTGLYILNMDTMKIEYKNFFPSNNFTGRFLWGEALKVEKGIWFSSFQYNVSSFYYDIEKDRFFSIQYPVQKEVQAGHPYCYMANYKDKIYVFPIKEQQILIYNLDRSFVKKVPIDIKTDTLTMHAAVNRNKVYLPVSNSNRIIEFDMETLNYSYIVIGAEDIKILDIIFAEGCLYFVSKMCAELYCYELKSKILKKTVIVYKESQIDSLGYDGQNIWGTILYENKIFKIDIQFRQLELWDIPIQKIELPNNCIWRKKALLNYRYMINYRDNWYITSDYENVIYVFSRKKQKFINRISVSISQDIEDVVLFKMKMQRSGIIREDTDNNLRYYLKMIKNDRGDMIWKA